ncbi:hypothetical protein Drorol1_Dr00026335 [Drosera rotundifolia]
MFKLKTKLTFISRHGTTRISSSISSPHCFDLPPQSDQINEPNCEIRLTHIAESSESSTSPCFTPRFLVSSLIACTNVNQIRQVHAQILITDMIKNLLVANKLLYLYAQYTDLSGAYKVFDKMSERDSVSWSVVVGGFAKAGDYSSCFMVFSEMVRSGIQPDSYTLPNVIRVCRDLRDAEMGRLVHDVVCKFGMSEDPFVAAALVDMYAKSGEIKDAEKLFDRMPVKDLVTWTVMIGAYGECGNAKESMVLFDRMQEIGIFPDRIALSTVVNACGKLGSLHKAREVHDYICSRNISLDVILGTAMIDMYSKCGSVDLARDIFEMMRERNVVTWSAMIAAYGYHGLGEEALELFSIMLQNRIAPNRVTFLSLLYACSHAGLIEQGIRIFALMLEKYSIRPDVKHYTCMIDLFGRAGRLDEAAKLIDEMGVERDEGVWSALLGACRIHRNYDLAKKAASSLLEMHPQNSGHYVLLSNIYSKAQSWTEMAKIRELMTQRKLKKVPGWTWIEVDSQIHQFSVWDWRHPRSKEIYWMLENLKPKLELAGYVPDTDLVLQDVGNELKKKMIYTHSEKLAIAFGLIATPDGTPIRITKNLRTCGDCHTFCKLVSKITNRLIVVRDANRFHHFSEGVCSCGDYW